jgi:ParB family chromosome partitioning protein
MSGSKYFKAPAGDVQDPVLSGLLQISRPGERRDGPSTLVGRVGMQPALGIAAENEKLRAERAAGMVLLRLDPKSIQATAFANRDPASLAETDPELRHLKELIAAQGQHQPIRVRPAPAGSSFEYEIVFGHRRHAACLALDRETEGGFPVLALLDAEAVERERLVLLMHAENDAHRQLSPFEYGQMYRSWLDAGIYPNQTALAAAVRRDQRSVSAYVRLAQLPEAVLDAFGDRRRIALRWVDKLASALASRRVAVLAAAARLSELSPRADAETVFQELTRAGVERRASTSREETVKVDGRVACRIARREGRITLRLSGLVPKAQQKEIAEEIRDLLERRLAGRHKEKSG